MVGCKIQGYCKYVLGYCDNGGMYFGGDAMVWVSRSCSQYD